MVTADIVGWIGTACLVIGYGLVSARNRAPGMLYQCLNLGGAVGLVINGAYHGAWPSVGLNIMWLSIGLLATVRIIMRKLRPVEAPERVAS